MRKLLNLLIRTLLATGIARGGTIVPSQALPGYVQETFGKAS